jgi:hypothetical protein
MNTEGWERKKRKLMMEDYYREYHSHSDVVEVVKVRLYRRSTKSWMNVTLYDIPREHLCEMVEEYVENNLPGWSHTEIKCRNRDDV